MLIIFTLGWFYNTKQTHFFTCNIYRVIVDESQLIRIHVGACRIAWRIRKAMIFILVHSVKWAD